MKKILIALFSLCLMFTVSNENAWETCGCQDNTETVKKECSSSKADANSSAKKCCKSKKNKSCSGENGKYSSGSTSGFSFASSNSTEETKKCGSDLEEEVIEEPTENDDEDNSDE